jgi:type VI protein secretion system component Hcp
MAKQSKKAGASKGRDKVQVKDLSKSQENVSRKQMKNIKGGVTTQDFTFTKKADKSSP